MQRKLRQMFPQTQFITQISISDDENDDENFSSFLINMLKRIHIKHLFVRNLPTGATKDISGQVRCCLFCSIENQIVLLRKHFNFR